MIVIRSFVYIFSSSSLDLGVRVIRSLAYHTLGYLCACNSFILASLSLRHLLLALARLDFFTILILTTIYHNDNSCMSLNCALNLSSGLNGLNM